MVTPLPAEPLRQKSLFHVLMLAVAVPVLILSFVLYNEGPANVMIPWLRLPLPPTCGMQKTFGLDCPGCGLTRSFIALAHGDLTASLAFNPGGILVFGLVLFQIPYRVAQLLRIRWGHDTWDLTTASLWLWSVIGVVLLMQWIVKMIL